MPLMAWLSGWKRWLVKERVLSLWFMLDLITWGTTSWFWVLWRLDIKWVIYKNYGFMTSNWVLVWILTCFKILTTSPRHPLQSQYHWRSQASQSRRDSHSISSPSISCTQHSGTARKSGTLTTHRNKRFEEAKHESLLAYHSSSSTGMPKIYVWNHDYAA
jgi:hypothetical protein